MALKADRHEFLTDVSYFMNETATKGVIVSHVTATSGSGAALDDSNAVVQLPNNANGSGETPAGLLLDDVVNLDLTRQHLNQHQREVQIGGKVVILKNGFVVTNSIETGYNPVPGAPAYFTTDGELNSTSTNSTQVGRWMGSKDSDGYAKVAINIL